MPELVFRFAEALRALLAARDPRSLEGRWSDLDICELGWTALGQARREQIAAWEPALDEIDGLLLRLLDRLPVLAAGRDPDATHFRTFRLPELERLQHASAAALVVQRFGIAGLRTVLEDQTAPIGRRYYAFLALAERHPGREWGLFARYLTPSAHHAFVGAAVEAARFYRTPASAQLLVALFESIRNDLHLRAFLSPRILESLYVLEDGETLPFLRDLLTCGFTDPDPLYCEVTRALVMVRRLTGQLEANSKYPDLAKPGVLGALDEAERLFDRLREVVQPVAVI
jgi:hypothetical protein